MKRKTALFVSLILVFSFLTGFTYSDISSGAGMRGLIISANLLPNRMASALNSVVNRTTPELRPVETYSAVYSYLESNYYGKKPDGDQLTYFAIRGMLAALGDRYTRFMDPEEYKTMMQENRGDFQGIGAELDSKAGRIFIKRPLKNSPALRAGVKAGDVILKIDEEPVQGMEIEQVVKLIRGERGTKVKLTVEREGSAKPVVFEIVRDIIPFTIVEYKMADDSGKIGYIALKQFNEKADKQFDEALSDLESQGMQALVLDLRGNPGGLLDIAVDIASRFIKGGNVVIIKNKGGRTDALAVEPWMHKHKMRPLAVLINGMSASASEILAGAIQDHKAGTIVGTNSFGKGLVQTIMALDGGSAVAITTAKYLTPGGRDVNKTKICPDIVIEPSETDLKDENDVQLKKAIEVLKEKIGTKQARVRIKS
jgi:carboxyl-terminal processing protease